METILRRTLQTAGFALGAALFAGSASAADVAVYLRATRFDKPLPVGPAAKMWGFESCNATYSACSGPSVPGPQITAQAGDTLRIWVRNTLTVPVSIVIPGQARPGAPVIVSGRARSLTNEVAPGASGTGPTPAYSFPSLAPGTFLYQSGTMPSIQVPMGLYGALVVNDAGYPGAAYQAERLLLFSEIDAVQNAAVNAAAGPAAYPSTIDYNPKYFLVNGVAFDSAAAAASTFAAGSPGDTLLLRLANAGLRSHIATVVGLDLTVRAEDGNLYPRPRDRSAVLLPAGKTHDATAPVSEDRTYAVYDRMLDLTNADAPGGGMLAYLRVGAGSTPPTTPGAAQNDFYPVIEDTPLDIPPNGVLANDGGLMSPSVVVEPTHGTVLLDPDGSFLYTPNADFAGTDWFVYLATGGGTSSAATVVLTVTATNDPPMAREDSFSNTFAGPLDVAAPGVLGNDGDPEGDVLTAVAVGTFPGLQADGSILAGVAGTYQYQARDGSGALSPAVTVTLAEPPVRGLALNVLGVEPGGATTPVSDYRWLVEEDTTWKSDPTLPDAPNLGTNFHRSYMPVVAQGCSGAGCTSPPIGELRLDPAKHYYVSVLPRSAGSGTGHTNGGAPIAVGQTSVIVYVNRQPLPPAQISVFVFNDNAPTNGTYDGGTEVGLGGFQIVIEDAGGRYGQNGGRALTDLNGNPLTNAKAGTPGCPASVATSPGIIITCPDGTALIQNLAPAKYGVSVVPPLGSTDGWTQTSTIEGTKVNDAWVKPNEPEFFQELGPPGYHTFFGFVSPREIGTPPGPGGSTVSGRVTNMHMARPPVMTLHDAGTNEAMAHTTAWVGLNSANGAGANIAAVKADSEGRFTIPNVPDGTYQLVVWDDYLDQIIAYRTLTLPGGGALGTVPVFQWFARLEHNVFRDDGGGNPGNAENGRRDDGEAPLIEQNINIRFRDGSIYQSYPTDHQGFVPFDQVFPFFNWMVAEVDYARFKPTGVTVSVDAGGPLPADNSVFTPQDQTELGTCPDGNVCTSTTRTETGPQLLQAFQGFLGQTSVLDWGKVPYAAGENGGISGVVYYASTRAENDPRKAAADTWEPGIPRVKVRLHREVPALGGGTRLALVDEVLTDSWDHSLPAGCPGDTSGATFVTNQLGGDVTKCYDGLRNFNQVRPGVFDGGYAFNDLPPGEYVVEVIPPPGYELVKEEDKNVDFGDAYGTAPIALTLPNLGMALALPDQAMVADVLLAKEPEPGIAQPVCVGTERVVPPLLTLFEDQSIEAPYAGDLRPLCDRKEVVLSDRSQAAADFFLFTSTPIAGHFTGMILDDLSQEFDQNSPQFGEKWAPPFVPVAIRDWTGREISRLLSDKWGRINGLVPSTFTANVPSPSGYAPNMITTCMNDPGPVSLGGTLVTDPYFDPRYTNFCYTFQYMPGTTTYLDTPVLPTSAFAAGDPPVDCAFPDLTPVIREVHGTGVGPFVNPSASATLTVRSMGEVAVPNPAYTGPTGTAPRTILRNYGFGGGGGVTANGYVGSQGQSLRLGNVALRVLSWNNDEITASIRDANGALLVSNPTRAQLVVYRGGSPPRASITAVTVSVSPETPLRVPQQYPTIQAAVDAAPPGGLVLVGPGAYDELVVVSKPVQLQGAGAGSTTINAAKRPSEKLVAWRARVDALVASGAVDPLPGQEFGAGGLEPDTLNTEEGAGVTVLATSNQGSPSAFALGRPARIDGFTITGGDTGGGIFVNGWAHYLEISNNKVHGNAGYYHGGVRVGRPFLQALADQAGPYLFNRDLRIHNNAVTQNAVLQDGTVAGGAGGGGGGIALCTGSDNYQLFDNWVCGNFSQGHAGGVAHFGRSDNGQILRNRILFNQSFNQGSTRSGGGLYIAGEPGGEPGEEAELSLGSGRNLIVDANLIQGNHAGAGHGGGVRLESVNGADRARGCSLTVAATDATACYQVRLINNMIVNNVAGGSGGGISMFDAARLEIVNNTIARNDSTATIGGLFATPNTSVPQPAGVASELHSALLAAAVPGTTSDFSNPGGTVPTIGTVGSFANNVIWQNRSMFYDQSGGDGQLLPDPGGVAFSATGCLVGTGARAWDLGIVGLSGSTPRLNPTFSILTAAIQHNVNYTGSNNSFTLTANHIVGEYCNGPRSAGLTPEPTTLQAAPALDEGGNWIDVRYGPISLTGDYHLSAGTNPAYNTGTPTTAPATDFDGQGRPLGGSFDRGADERNP